MQHLQKTLLSLPMLLVIVLPAALAQTKLEPAQMELPSSSAFDVVSIKRSDAAHGISSWGWQGDLYSASNTSLWLVIVDAYLPGSGSSRRDQVANGPAWLDSERYDIRAKLDEPSAALFNRLSRERKQQQGAPLLQKWLKDCCKLVVHVMPMQVDGMALVLDKSGPKFKEARPGEELPKNIQELASGGKVARPSRPGMPVFFQMTMRQLTDYFMQSGLVIEDRTGLTGTYDLILARTLLPPDADPQDRVQSWGWKAAGLKVVPVRVTAQKVVIDHIEHPAAN